MTIAEAIYLLCGLTSLVAAFMLLRHYRQRRTRLLLWSVIAFVGLAVNNVMVYVDLVMFAGVDLSVYRTAAGSLAMLALVYGLVWETRQ
jgi:Family of unknown function (DUF5985)